MDRLKPAHLEYTATAQDVTVFLNAPESERIFPITVGNFAVRNPYLIIKPRCLLVEKRVGSYSQLTDEGKCRSASTQVRMGMLG